MKRLKSWPVSLCLSLMRVWKRTSLFHFFTMSFRRPIAQDEARSSHEQWQKRYLLQPVQSLSFSMRTSWRLKLAGRFSVACIAC